MLVRMMSRGLAPLNEFQVAGIWVASFLRCVRWDRDKAGARFEEEERVNSQGEA